MIKEPTLFSLKQRHLGGWETAIYKGMVYQGYSLDPTAF